MNKIVLTFDTDWIPEEILTEIIEELRRKKLKATVFATNDYEILKNPPPNIEVAIHPNFDQGDFKKQTESIKKVFPRAVGVRNHSLLFSERLRPVWQEFRIQYSSNAMALLEPNLKPYLIGKNIVELPLYFMDRFYLEMTEPKTDFSLKALKLNQPGLKIFDFHPIHLALNTPNQKYYEKQKKHYQAPAKLKKHVFLGQGTRTLYNQLINHIVDCKIKTYCLRDLLKKP